MMTFFCECPKCALLLVIEVKTDEVRLFKELASDDGVHIGHCPTCTEEMHFASSHGRVATHVMSMTQFYKASHGLPLPSEKPTEERVQNLFCSGAVVEASTEAVGELILLHELRFADGHKMHFCASGRGAQILKITKG